MIKKLLSAAVLLSLVLLGGCAKGGSGPCATNCPTLTLNNTSNGILQVSQAPVTVPITITATFMHTTETAVNWSITGTSCTGSPNPCGSFTSTASLTATYQAPSTVPTDPSITIVATAQGDSSLTALMPLTVVDISTAVQPAQSSVGLGLAQQFTTVALPDNAPQQFTWSCTANGVPCVNFIPGSNGAMVYTPVAAEKCNNCVKISTLATADPNSCAKGCTPAQASVVTSRLSGNSANAQFAFRFSGYDNNGKQVLVAGTFTAIGNGISSGIEDEISWNGSEYAYAQHLISGGSYTPINSSDPSSNNSGTLVLTTGVAPNHFQVVLDAAGDIQMIESDGQGNGAGVAEPVANNNGFNSGNQTFAFGFTGVDSSANRAGYAGLMPINSGAVVGGMMDTNDNGNTTNICGSSPCNNVAGSYSYDPNSNLGSLILTSAVTMHFDFFVAKGTTNATNPLTLYAISTDPDATHPAVLGTMVYQDPSPGTSKTYDLTAFNGSSISALTGTNANVSLTYGTTNGSGGFTGGFDQNKEGTMVSVPYSPGFTFTYAPAPSSATNGRYTFQMLGNPTPMAFILYASGANRGFLLDQSSPAVITGTMDSQSTKVAGTFAASAMPGTFAVATNSCSASGTNACNASSLAPLTMNLLLTSPGNSVFNVAGTQNPPGPSGNVTGQYAIQFTGTGTIGLTAPATENYIIYAVDRTHFYMIRDASKDKGVASAILFAAQ